MKKKGVCVMALLSVFPLFGLSKERSAHQLAGNLMAYPYLEQTPPAQSETPAGYEPFHMEHYGRHGSRWLIGGNDYLIPVRNLEKAEKAGLLTPLGDSVLKVLRDIQTASVKREGELSDLGALQHQAIGRRMAANFPSIFNEDADIDAKSTVVIRCIISMANAIQGIRDVAPGVKPAIDASYADMWFMNYDDKPAWVVKDSAEAVYLNAYNDKLKKNDGFLNRLVTDSQFAEDSVAPGLLPYLYWVLANTQSHSDQPWIIEQVFSPEELEANWRSNNAYWFVHGGNSSMTNGRMPFTQRKLLGRIIERTDSAIKNGRPGANLRFGHDGILLNLVTLMELGDFGREINSLEELDSSEWNEFDIIPMAGNLQIIFYRPVGKAELTDDDILVKTLLNEREVTMPGVPAQGTYYRWKDLKNYYSEKLRNFTD